MAYVVNKLQFADTGSSSQLTIDLPTHSQNDLVLIFVHTRFNTFTAPTGYTEHASSGALKVFGKYESGTPATTATMTATDTAPLGCGQVIILRGTASSSYVDTTASRASSSGEILDAPSVTPTAADTLVLACIGLPDTDYNYLSEGKGIQLGMIGVSFQVGCGVQYTQHPPASTATGTFEFIPGAYVNTHNPNGITIAIKDSGSGDIGTYYDIGTTADYPCEMLHRSGNDFLSGKLATTAWDPTSSVITTINSVTTYTENLNSGSEQSDLFDVAFYESGSDTNNGKIAMDGAQLVTSQDLTGELVLFTHYYVSSSYQDNGIPASVFAISDGTNARIWSVGGADALPNMSKGIYPTLIDMAETTLKFEDKGTFDVTTCDRLAVGAYQAAKFLRQSFGPIFKMQTMKVLGGSSNVPSDFDKLKDIADGNGWFTVQAQGGQTVGQFYIMHNIQIGNDSDDVYWDSTNQSVEYPAAPDLTSTPVRPQAMIGEASLTFTVDAGTGNTVIIANQVFNMGDYHTFKLLSGANSGSANLVLNATVTVGNMDNAISGITFSACKEIQTETGFDLTGGSVVIDACVDTYAITVTSQTELEDLQNVAFTDNNYSIKITGNHGGETWSLEGATVSGGTGSYDIQYTGTGTLTITADSGSGWSTGRAEATVGTLTISAPTDDLTINSSESASQIHVYTTNTQTTVATTASGTQLVYTHSGQTVDITVLKDGFIPFRQTGLTLSGDQIIDVSLVKSREYDSSHGLTYGSGNDGSIYDNRSVITGITQANPAVVTYSGTDLWSNNDIVSIQDVVGMTEVNGKRYTVANVNTGANTFELSGINSTAYTAYSSGGIVLSGLDVNTFGPSVRGIFSMCMEEFKSNSALYNLPFNLELDGNGSLYLTDGVEGLADADVENMTAGGVEYLDIDATTTATWIGIESVGTIPGSNTGEWTADDATTVTDARATGVFDEIIKLYGDTDHGNFDNRANRVILKMNINGYREERVNVRELYGVSGNFGPNHFVVPVAPVAIEAATGDPALTTDPVITDHGATPASWNGKNFGLTITDGATPNTGEEILRHLNYFLRSANDTTLDGNDPFSWPEMVLEVVAGTSYETAYGYTEDAQTGTLKGVRVVKNDGTTAHPDFIRYQSDDGTYYTPPTVSNISVSGMPTTGANIRLQIHNDTAKTASAWAATTAYSLGDKVLRSTGLGSEQTAGLYFVCTTAGTTGGIEPTWDTVVGNTTVDGTVTWTTYAILFYDDDPASASYADSYTELEEFKSGDTYRIRFAEMDGATSFSIYETTGLVSATGFTVPVSVTADSVYATNAVDGSSAAVTAKFTADYVNDELDLDADQDFAVTEAFAYYCYELTTSQGMYEFWGGVTAIDPANYRNNTANVSIYFDETAGFVKQTDSARWFRDDDTRPAIDPTTGGNGLEINWRNPVYGYDAGGGGFTAGDRATLDAAATQSSVTTIDTNVDAVKVKTDQLTFTKTNELDSNIQSVNDVTVTGTGASGDEWGP